MASWVPLFQTLVWPVFIAMILVLIGRQRLHGLLDAFVERVKKGQGPVRLPGIELPGIPQGPSEEVVKEELQREERKEQQRFVGSGSSQDTDSIKNEILKHQIQDWAFRVSVNWAMIDPLLTAIIVRRVLDPREKERIGKRPVSERIKMIATQDFGLPTELLQDLNEVLRTIEEHRKSLSVTDKMLKQLKEAFFRTERTRFHLQYQTIIRM